MIYYLTITDKEHVTRTYEIKDYDIDNYHLISYVSRRNQLLCVDFYDRTIKAVCITNGAGAILFARSK